MVAPVKIMSDVPSRGRMKEVTVEPANLKVRGKRDSVSSARVIEVLQE